MKERKTLIQMLRSLNSALKPHETATISSPRPIRERCQRLLAALGYSCLSSLPVSRESTVVPSKRRWPVKPHASNGVECVFGFLHLRRTDEPCSEREISFALEPRRPPRWWVSLPTAWRGALPGLDTRIGIDYVFKMLFKFKLKTTAELGLKLNCGKGRIESSWSCWL